MKNDKIKNAGFSTQAIHGGSIKNQYGALSTPIYQTSTFVFDSSAQGGNRFALKEDGYIYSRLGNPTNTCLEEKIALLEGTESCISTASGIGAISSALWTALKSGDHVVASDTLYGCTFSFLQHGLTKFGVDITFCDASDPSNIEKAMRPETKVVYLETPANPSLKINDIESICSIAHRNKGCLVFVDNTFCTPYIQKPKDFGADVIIHSGTKYLNGHGDVIAGFVCGSHEFIKRVRFEGIKDMTGSVLSPFDAFLIIRGLKTLPIRMERHCQNAMKIAEFLSHHPAVKKVYYPGLNTFKQYDLAKKQMKLPGGMISFELNGGLSDGIKLMDSVKLCRLAVSLGDAETLIEHPASMTHSPYSSEERHKAGISDGLVRLSAGLEDADDIVNDLNEALNNL